MLRLHDTSEAIFLDSAYNNLRESHTATAFMKPALQFSHSHLLIGVTALQHSSATHTCARIFIKGNPQGLGLPAAARAPDPQAAVLIQ